MLYNLVFHSVENCIVIFTVYDEKGKPVGSIYVKGTSADHMQHTIHSGMIPGYVLKQLYEEAVKVTDKIFTSHVSKCNISVPSPFVG